MNEASVIAVVIPCYKVVAHIAAVVAAVPDCVARIYCVDDACPQQSGDYILAHISDPRVTVLRHECNKGVGGAVVTGYRQAIADGADIIVKVDGDGQMDPLLIPLFVAPIVGGQCDYTKGNRFYYIDDVLQMPRCGFSGMLF